MGRDEALAERLGTGEHELHVLGQWANPGLVEKAEASGGEFRIIDSVTNVDFVADYVEGAKPDMFLTNFDDALAAGVVDAIRKRIGEDILIPCPNRAAAKVEWDKFYLREIIAQISPKHNPVNFMVESADELHDAISFFAEGDSEIVLKPRGLTGGKGVKVQGKHFKTHKEGHEYALEVLAAPDQRGIEVQERLEGHEFTLQLLTDGTTLIEPPVTYDYPYREDGDEGPGTGGMGTFSMKDGLLPFVDQADYDEAVGLMRRVLAELKSKDHDYKGVLYPTFFKTERGLKIVEINARGGDPELINILDLIEDDVNLGDVLTKIATGELTTDTVRYKKLASAMVYLVSPDYGYAKGPSYEFSMNPRIIEELGCKIRFAATERVAKNKYRSVGSSRTVGISALGSTPWEARVRIHQAIQAGFDHPLPLKFRQQIAEKTYVNDLRRV